MERKVFLQGGVRAWEEFHAADTHVTQQEAVTWLKTRSGRRYIPIAF